MLPGLFNGQLKTKRYATGLAAEIMRRDATRFAKAAWHVIEPKPCVWNWHMDAIIEHLVYVTLGEIRFLLICVPPRSTKSLLVSVLWPVWHWLENAGTQFICASYTPDLSKNFAVLSRRLIEGEWFQRLYPKDFFLLPDENRGGMYKNNKGGYRMSISVKGALSTGFGGDIQLLDDPLSSVDAQSDTETNNALIWHDSTWRSRVNDPNKSQKVVTAQRLRANDIPGHIIETEGHRWVQLILPMEFEKKSCCVTYKNDGNGVKEGAEPIFTDPRKVEGELLNPKRFNAEAAEAEKRILSDQDWNAQYQQRPEGAGGLIFKRHWWRKWQWPDWHKDTLLERPLPAFDEIIQVYDTALEEDEQADFNARTTWGLFTHMEQEKDIRTGRVVESGARKCAILLESMERRMEYPDLRDEIIESNNIWSPDRILIEKKVSGHALLQELRRKRLPVVGVRIPNRDKVSRAKTSSLMLQKGCIFYIASDKDSRHVIDRAAKFPGGPKDLVDTLSIAWQYMRQYFDLSLDDEDTEQEIAPFNWKPARYG